ncbi:MAG: hypothetical protein AB8G22_25110 [Saprospiraceae bacterium]
MKTFFLKILLATFLLAVALPKGIGQTDDYLQENLLTEIDNEQQWRDITNRTELKEFKELVDELEKERTKKKSEKEEKLDYQLGEPHPAVVAIIKFLLIATGIGIIAFLLYKLMGEVNAPRDRKIKKGRLSEISLEEIEENIVEADLPDFIEQAIAEENYSLAIRLYYLLIIKELSANNLIQYKKDKTNRSYLSELSGTDFYTNFQQTTQIFERIWYGQDELNKTNFLQIQPAFQQFITSIQNQPTTT